MQELERPRRDADAADRLVQRHERIHRSGHGERRVGDPGREAEADDAVQETWLRLSRTDAETIDNLGAWLTTVVSRVCLNALRAREARPEKLVAQIPDPGVAAADDPQHEAELADGVGLALLVVLETL